MTEPRGVRNNNPGNLRWNARSKWVGLADPPMDDKGFCRFEDPVHGIRAIALLLQYYQDKKGFFTIREMITAYAPPTENQTGKYVRFVAGRVGCSPDERVDVQRYEIARPMVEAIIQMENGRQPYSSALIDEGLRRAGVVRAAPRTLRDIVQTDTVKGTTVATGATAAAGAVANIVPSLYGLDARVAVVIVVIVAVAALVGVFLWRSKRA